MGSLDSLDIGLTDKGLTEQHKANTALQMRSFVRLFFTVPKNKPK
jgi:hypothetical protein